MDQPFTHTLSFADLEVLVLAEDGGTTPCELADSLGFELEEARALVDDLVRRGLLVGEHDSTAFQLTPLARLLRNDAGCRDAAFAAALQRRL